MSSIKQVIVWRHDLKVRKGKMMAQAAHASLGAVLMIQESSEDDWPDALQTWLDSGSTKICVYVNDEDELIELYQKACDHGVPAKLITDAGHTEFDGVPTKTCVAVGPWYSDVLDALLTGDLPLL